MNAQTVLAGWASAEITPTIPCWMGGYGDRTSPAESIHDPIYANALAIGGSTTPFIVIICDLVAVDATLVATIRERVAADIPGAVVWIGATHTHSGPDVGRLLAERDPEPEVVNRIVTGAAQAGRDAARQMSAVHAAWASGRVDGVATNRDHPDNREELAIDLLCLYTDSARNAPPAAVFGSFPCHPTVMSASNLAISADLPGAFRRQLQARLGGDTWVALATGSAGDISTRHVRRGQGFEELDRLGSLLADAAQRCLADARPITLAHPTVREEPVTLQHKPPLDAAALTATAGKLREQRSAALEAGNVAQARTLETALQGIRAAERVGAIPANVSTDVPVAVARAGELAVVAIPGELYNRLGMQLRAGEQSPLLLLGYTNGYVGYIPTREAYQSLDYEVLMSPLSPGSGEDLIAAALRLLNDTKAVGS